jgi:hypothetical protein
MEINEDELHIVAKKHAQGMRQYKLYLHPHTVQGIQRLFPDLTRQEAIALALQHSVHALPLRDKLHRLLHRWQNRPLHESETVLLNELKHLLETEENNPP